MGHTTNGVDAAQAIGRLKQGNKAFLDARTSVGDVSPEMRLHGYEHGQQPYAVIVACSDSRVIPESMFSAGLGELFVIRVAGNIIDAHQLGSIEYATEHLGCKLVVVLGHTRCGAVTAAIKGETDGHIKYVIDEIKDAIGDETDDLAACKLNVQHSIARIEESLDIRREEQQDGLQVVGAVYHLDTGVVEFM